MKPRKIFNGDLDLLIQKIKSAVAETKNKIAENLNILLLNTYYRSLVYFIIYSLIFIP